MFRVIVLGEHADGLHLFIVLDVFIAGYGGVRHVVFIEFRQPVFPGGLGESRIQYLNQFGHVL